MAQKRRSNLFSVHVNNLSMDVNKEELLELFSEAGKVHDHHICLDPPKGNYTYAFMRYASLEECQEAISLLDGYSYIGRTLRVSMAKIQPGERRSRPRDDRDRDKSRGRHQNESGPHFDQARLRDVRSILQERNLNDCMPLLMNELKHVEYSLFPIEKFPHVQFSLDTGPLEELMEAKLAEEQKNGNQISHDVVEHSQIYSPRDSPNDFGAVSDNELAFKPIEPARKSLELDLNSLQVSDFKSYHSQSKLKYGNKDNALSDCSTSGEETASRNVHKKDSIQRDSKMPTQHVAADIESVRNQAGYPVNDNPFSSQRISSGFGDVDTEDQFKSSRSFQENFKNEIHDNPLTAFNQSSPRTRPKQDIAIHDQHTVRTERQFKTGNEAKVGVSSQISPPKGRGRGLLLYMNQK